MLEHLKQQIEPLAQAQASSLGVEIIEVQVRPGRDRITIDVTADKTSGITIDECARLNKQLAAAIEDQNTIEGDWIVEVASPGLDRPLKTLKDFQRVSGNEVRIHLSDFVDGKKEYYGQIQEVTEDQLKIKVKGNEIVIPFNVIQVGKQLI